MGLISAREALEALRGSIKTPPVKNEVKFEKVPRATPERRPTMEEWLSVGGSSRGSGGGDGGGLEEEDSPAAGRAPAKQDEEEEEEEVEELDMDMSWMDEKQVWPKLDASRQFFASKAPPPPRIFEF